MAMYLHLVFDGKSLAFENLGRVYMVILDVYFSEGFPSPNALGQFFLHYFSISLGLGTYLWFQKKS